MTTPKDQMPRSNSKLELTPEEQRQLDIGRDIMKQSSEAFQALAK